jgi:hypothetical protein
MSRDLDCSRCGRHYHTRIYRLPHLCPECDPDHPEHDQYLDYYYGGRHADPR